MGRHTWAAVLGVVLMGTAGYFLIRAARRPVVLQGAVLREDTDPRKQQPIPDTEIVAVHGRAAAPAKSDAQGFFRLELSRDVDREDLVTLRFGRPGYQPLELTAAAGDGLFIARLQPTPQADAPPPSGPQTVVANVAVRYSVKAATRVDVGSAVKAFDVVNTGNVLCQGRKPCSPDGRWKAALGATSLDAGEGNEFRNARVTCIAGPCPFTRIETDEFSRGGRHIGVTVRNWSDTATFLVEAEVSHVMETGLVRQSYPAIFGRTLDFSVPPGAEGTSLQAEINGAEIVFPLGPELRLSWAECKVNIDPGHTNRYRCELKPGYRFRD